MTTDRSHGRPILVAGAGPVGLATAIGLARGGAPVRVIDRAPAPSQRSKALLVWPRTLEVLDALDAGGAERIRRSLPVASFRYYSSARPIARIGFSERTRPVILPQPEVEALLLAAAQRAGVQVERGVQLLGFEQREDRVAVRLGGPGPDEQEAEFAYVVGADGASSTVREQLGLPFDGLTYPATFMLADALVDGAPDHDSVHYYCSPRGVLVLIGLPNGRFRVFTSAPADFEPTGDQDADLAALQRMVDLRGPGGLRLHSASWSSTFAVHARSTERYRVGRVFLAGDAVHIHSPAGGQGLNTGVTDAHNLAWKLAAVWRGEAPPALLDSYEAERLSVAEAVVRQADLQTRAWLIRRPLSVLARDWTARLASATGMFDHRYVPWLAGLRTRYTTGAVSAVARGAAGRGPLRSFRPGALAPDLPVRGTGGDAPCVPLRAALSSSAYTLLLIGRTAPGSGLTPGPGLPAGAVETRRLVDGTLFAPEDRTPSDEGSVAEGMVLIRPDGHVAAVGTGRDHSALISYVQTWLREPEHREEPVPSGAAL